MASKLHGIKVVDRKETMGMPSVKMPVPATVTIPTSMHIGKPVTPTVKVGDEVMITDGLFSGYKGTVQSITDDLKTATVLVKRGSRDMPVELDTSVIKLA